MKTILIFVASLDGKITRWGNPHVRDWSSYKDQQHYKHIWDDAQLIVMGSNTFAAEHFEPSCKRLLLVLTRQPEKYNDNEVPDQLHFTNSSPLELVKKFSKKGISTMVVIGGAHVATSFLKQHLIDEVWLTIEPKIFGTGGSFVIEEKLHVDLRLISCEKVNDLGTLITKYAVLK